MTSVSPAWSLEFLLIKGLRVEGRVHSISETSIKKKSEPNGKQNLLFV